MKGQKESVRFQERAAGSRERMEKNQTVFCDSNKGATAASNKTAES